MKKKTQDPEASVQPEQNQELQGQTQEPETPQLPAVSEATQEPETPQLPAVPEADQEPEIPQMPSAPEAAQEPEPETEEATWERKIREKAKRQLANLEKGKEATENVAVDAQEEDN